VCFVLKESEEMVSVVSEVFEKAARSKAEKQRQNWLAYSDLLRDLVAGNDVDATEFEIVLQMVQKTQAEVENDVESMRRRLEWYALAQTRPERQAALQKVNSEFEAAQREYSEAVQRLGSIVSQKRSAVTQAEMQLGIVSDAENRLVANCDDPAIRFEEKENARKRFEVIAKQREIAELLNINNLGSPGRRFYEVESEIHTLQNKIASERWIYQPGIVAEYRRKISSWEKHLEQMRPTIDGLRRQVSECDAEFARLTNDMAELQKRKLQP
jgi:chromosome segregation ATPase